MPDDVGFLLAKASTHFNDELLRRFAERGFAEVRASFGSLLVPLFDEDGLRLGELGRRALLSKQAITGLVKACEAAGLVEREVDQDDARACRVRLSERGRAFQAVAGEVLGELDRELLAAVGRRDRDALTRALKGVLRL